MIASLQVKAPAQYDAAISPLEWPTTADGFMPQAARRSTSAICNAVQIGWEYSALRTIFLSSTFKMTSVSW